MTDVGLLEKIMSRLDDLKSELVAHRTLLNDIVAAVNNAEVNTQLIQTAQIEHGKAFSVLRADFDRHLARHGTPTKLTPLPVDCVSRKKTGNGR
jgi:hypothetical protein